MCSGWQRSTFMRILRITSRSVRIEGCHPESRARMSASSACRAWPSPAFGQLFGLPFAWSLFQVVVSSAPLSWAGDWRGHRLAPRCTRRPRLGVKFCPSGRDGLRVKPPSLAVRGLSQFSRSGGWLIDVNAGIVARETPRTLPKSVLDTLPRDPASQERVHRVPPLPLQVLLVHHRPLDRKSLGSRLTMRIVPPCMLSWWTCITFTLGSHKSASILDANLIILEAVKHLSRRWDPTIGSL